MSVHRIFVIALVIGAGAVAAPVGSARPPMLCSCSLWRGTPDYKAIAESEIQRSPVVFLGTVDSMLTGPRRVRFRVARWFKGGDGDTVTLGATAYPVRNDSLVTSCDLDFRAGAAWLIFSETRGDGLLRASHCSGTRRREEADSILQYLGVGWTPRAR